jgi:hypothetical protein
MTLTDFTGHRPVGARGGERHGRGQKNVGNVSVSECRWMGFWLHGSLWPDRSSTPNALVRPAELSAVEGILFFLLVRVCVSMVGGFLHHGAPSTPDPPLPQRLRSPPQLPGLRLFSRARWLFSLRPSNRSSFVHCRLFFCFSPLAIANPPSTPFRRLNPTAVPLVSWVSSFSLFPQPPG